MKDSNQAMNILEAYDLYQSYNQAARECQCSPNTVRSLVAARREGTLAARGEREPRSSLFEPQHLVLITSLVEESKGQVRADVIHRRLVTIGFSGSERTTRRAVRKEKARYRRANARVYWPWIPEPGKWAQYDFSDGSVVNGTKTTLFHFYLPYSRHRLVQRIPDQSLPNVIAALHDCFVMVGGVPRCVLTDNAKTAATTHVAGIGVLNAKMVKFASAYGFSLFTCVPYDPASKGGVERAVRVAKEHLCPRETNLLDDYESLEQLEEAIAEFNREINAKVHTSSGKIPALVLDEERSLFAPLPATPYVAAYGVMRKVEANMGIVRYRRCGYSVDPNLRGSPVYVREVGDEVVIVTVARERVTEVARHKRGEPYAYVISDQHKDLSHPSGPLVRHPIPTSMLEAKFLAISPIASTWLERAANVGPDRIPGSIEMFTTVEPNDAIWAMEASLRVKEFDAAVISALLFKAKRIRAKTKTEPAQPTSQGSSTQPYAKLERSSTHD